MEVSRSVEGDVEPELDETLFHLQMGARERRRTESNRRMEVLQTSALPLGYGARESEKLNVHAAGRTSLISASVFPSGSRKNASQSS